MAHTPGTTSAAVGAVIPERTRATSGDFDDALPTLPTKTQVQSLIGGIVNEVQAVVGMTVDDLLAPLADLTVAVGVAAQVELDFTNDTAEDRQSKWQQLHDWFEQLLGRLNAAQSTITNGGVIGQDTTDAPPSIWFTVPDDELFGFPRTTWASRF